jgi:hypothetical protein
MLEKQLASLFDRVLDSYKIWTLTTKQGGLPDKGVQLNNSRIVWFELKIVTTRPGATTISVPTLASHQASWLANWQKNDGDCYLFVGANNSKYKTDTYGIYRPARWQEWTKVPNNPLPIDNFQIYTMELAEVYHWFHKQYGVIQPARSNVPHDDVTSQH